MKKAGQEAGEIKKQGRDKVKSSKKELLDFIIKTEVPKKNSLISA